MAQTTAHAAAVSAAEQAASPGPGERKPWTAPLIETRELSETHFEIVKPGVQPDADGGLS
jgi:hypothetical protein